MRDGLERLFRPKSIAVIGGGAWCRNVILRSQEIGFSGPIWAVHPSRSEVAGVPAVASVADLPGAPDAAFVGVNRRATIEVVDALSAMRGGGAICFANGFLEAAGESEDAAEMQQQLLDAAGEMTLIGPNCYGYVNYLDGALLWPDQHGGRRVERGVAILTQSSNIAINLTMQARGLPIGYVVTAGNQAQTGFAEIGAALLADRRVTALGLHVEGVGDVSALENLAATARDMGKPIVALKVGRSRQAQVATVSHTASLAGSDAGGGAPLRRLGIAQVDTLSEFLETLKLLHVTGPLASGRIAAMSCSGGEASLIADTVLGHGLEFPALNKRQSEGLRAALGPMVTLANPLDYNTHIWPDTKAMIATFSALMDPSLALGMVVLDFPRGDRCDASDWDNVIEAVVQTRDATGVAMAIVATLPENMPEVVAERLIDLGIAPLCGLAEAVCAAGLAAELGKPASVFDPVLLARVPRNTVTQSEADAKAALAGFGLQVPRYGSARTPHEAAVLAEKIGFPVALKGAGLAHKTELGAVVLNLTSPAAVLAAAKAIPAQTYLVEEMLTDAVAELLIGVVLDPAHGYVLTLAAGGTLTEILQDSATMLVPASPAAVETALCSLRIFPVLDGYRSARRADINAIVQAVMAVQTYVQAHHGQIAEVEVNPLICGPQRAVAADALIRAGEADD